MRRFWPLFRNGGAVAVAPVPPGSLLLLEEALRVSMQDLFVARDRQAQGYTLRWSGDLLQPPHRVLGLLEARFKPYGYTPFLKRDKGVTWVQATPLAAVVERSRPAVNGVLFVLTLLSTIAAGCLVAGSFPFVTFDPLRSPARLLDGLPFAVTLLAILGTHEFGHYFTARAYGASVSLPYFIPAPPPLFLFGTLGAVIRMRSPARDRNTLFDIAAAGPLAGLAIALPAIALGIAWSRIMPAPPDGLLVFGDSLLMRWLIHLRFGAIPPG